MDDPNSRDRFYEFANWCYQGGVFVSRSSGTLFSHIHVLCVICVAYAWPMLAWQRAAFIVGRW